MSLAVLASVPSIEQLHSASSPARSLALEVAGMTTRRARCPGRAPPPAARSRQRRRRGTSARRGTRRRTARERRLVEVLDDDGRFVHRERDRLPIRASRMSGSTSASASAADRGNLRQLFAGLRDDSSSGLSSGDRLPVAARLLDDADEDVFEREASPRARRAPGRPRREPPADARVCRPRRRSSTMTCRRSPKSDTRQRSISALSRSAARCGSSIMKLQQVAALLGLDRRSACPRPPARRPP